MKPSPVIRELFRFADMDLSDSTDIGQFMQFREIDLNGAVRETDMARAVELYASLMKRPQVQAFPIFELKNSDDAILPIQGVGFGGAIWGKVLVDRNTLEIKKIAFEHQGETDGYGAGMTRTSFENAFVGATVNPDANTFALSGTQENPGGQVQDIEGISGATVTSAAVVEMVNEGLKKYKSYLIRK